MIPSAICRIWFHLACKLKVDELHCIAESKLEYNERKPSAYPKILKTLSKNPKIYFFFTLVKNWCPQLSWKLNEAIFPKIWIKSKQMKIIDVFNRFTSKAYSATKLCKKFHFYQLKVPKQLTWKFSVKSDIFKSAVWVLWVDINNIFT